MIRVVAAVIRNDNYLLLGQRLSNKRHGGLWEFPGGKIEPDETHTSYCTELNEEMALVLPALGIVFTVFRTQGQSSGSNLLRLLLLEKLGQSNTRPLAGFTWRNSRDEPGTLDRLFLDHLLNDHER